MLVSWYTPTEKVLPDFAQLQAGRGPGAYRALERAKQLLERGRCFHARDTQSANLVLGHRPGNRQLLRPLGHVSDGVFDVVHRSDEPFNAQGGALGLFIDIEPGLKRREKRERGGGKPMVPPQF